MIYRGYLTDINNNQWRVEFNTTPSNTETTYTDIKLSDIPVTVSLEGEDNNIFKPLKLSGATVRCWVDNYMFDLFTGEAKGVTCNIYKGDALFWTGYVTPNIYNQEFGSIKFELEVECRDKLSLVDEFKYSTTEIGIKSFAATIDEIIKQTGITGDIYYLEAYNKKLSELYVNEQNWFDEDGEPENAKTVLENILSYLCMTMFQVEDNVFIVNYSVLKSGGNVPFSTYRNGDYYRQEVINVDKTFDKFYSAQISLSEVYKGIDVNCSTYPFSSKFIPDIFEKEDIIKRVLNNKLEETVTLTGFGTGADKQSWKHYCEIFNTDKYKLYNYNTNGTEYSGEVNTTNYNSYFSSVLLKSWGYDIGAVNNGSEKLPSSIDWNYYIRSTDTIGNTSKKERKILSVVGSEYLTIKGGYLAFNCDVYISRYTSLYFPEYGKNAIPPDFKINSSYPISVRFSIKVGDKYLSETGELYDYEYKIKAVVGNTGDKFFNTWHSVKNTNTYLDDSGMSGFVIKLKNSELLHGKIVFSMFSVHAGYPAFPTSYYKNIKLEYKLPLTENASLTEEEPETDIIYSETINDDNVSDYEETKLLITTKNDLTNSKSATIVKNAYGFDFLTNLLHKTIGKQQIQEYNILNEYIKQLSRPAKKYNIQIKDCIHPYNIILHDSNKYIVDSVEYDVINGTSTINMIEKL